MKPLSLRVEALSENDEGYQEQKNAEFWQDCLARLVDYHRLNKLYEQAKSLPDINLLRELVPRRAKETEKSEGN